MISVMGLEKKYDDIEGGKLTAAVRGITFDVAAGEFFTLLGPSGCGKSTTLRCIAGLERLTAGEIRIAGRTVSSPTVFIPPSRRRIGMVFQSYAIWPHMTVFENVAFPLRQQGRIRPAALRQAVVDALDVVHMSELANRDAPYLSGGQQQRVALARALVSRPDVLLLDEPLSNLDARLRLEMRTELRRVASKVGITTLYVTHDQNEALALSDRIAVLSDGLVKQVGTPTEIYRQPASRFVAAFVGESNFVSGTADADAKRGEYLALSTSIGTIRTVASTELRKGQTATLMLRPEVLRLSPPGRADGEDWNHLDAVVKTRAFVGEYTDCVVAVNGCELFARLRSYEDVIEGQTISLRFRVGWTWIIPD